MGDRSPTRCLAAVPIRTDLLLRAARGRRGADDPSAGRLRAFMRNAADATRSRMPLRTLRCAVGLAIWMAAGGLARAEAQEPRGAADPARAIGTWVDSDQVDKELLDRTVTAVLDAGVPGLRCLGQRLRAAGPPAEPATKGLRSLATHVCLGFLKRQADSRIAFAGQYAP